MYISIFTLVSVLCLVGFSILAMFKMNRWNTARHFLHKAFMVESQESADELRKEVDKLASHEKLAKEFTLESWPASHFGAAAHFAGKFTVPTERLFTFSILDISPCPEAENAPYPDCLRTARVRLAGTPAISGLIGLPPDMEMVLVFWAFQDRKESPGAALKAGDMVMGWPYANIADDFASVQSSDTIDHEDISQFYLAQQTPVPTGGLTESIPVAPLSDPAELRRSTMQRLEQDLKAQGKNDWNAWIKETQPIRDTLLDVLSTHPPFDPAFSYHSDTLAPYLNMTESALVLPGMDGKRVSFVQHVKNVSDSLAKNGITLIYAPIPFKSQVCESIFLSPEDMHGQEEIAPAWRKLVYDLLTAGVEVVDLVPAFRDHWRDHPDQPLFLEDHHLSPEGLKLAAAAVAKHAARFVPQPDQSAPGILAKRPSTFEYSLVPHADVSRSLDADAIWIRGESGKLVPFAPDNHSPIIIAGDSTLWVARGKGKNLDYFFCESVAGARSDMAAHLSFELNHVVDEAGAWYSMAFPGMENIPAKRLAGKKALISLHMLCQAAMSPEINKEWITSDLMKK